MKFDLTYKPYSIYNHNEHSKIIILCDHASKTIPKKYKNLGLSQKNVNKHIGWDIGALKLAKKISKRTNSTLIYSGYSRLLVDCNRALQTKGAFIKKSEDIIIPGNLEINREEKILRAKKYYFPYHNKIKSILNKKLRKKNYKCVTEWINGCKYQYQVVLKYSNLSSLEDNPLDLLFHYI